MMMFLPHRWPWQWLQHVTLLSSLDLDSIPAVMRELSTMIALQCIGRIHAGSPRALKMACLLQKGTSRTVLQHVIPRSYFACNEQTRDQSGSTYRYELLTYCDDCHYCISSQESLLGADIESSKDKFIHDFECFRQPETKHHFCLQGM